jgi:hypothetical protein
MFPHSPSTVSALIGFKDQEVTFNRPKTMFIRRHPLQLLNRNTANLKTLVTLQRNL